MGRSISKKNSFYVEKKISNDFLVADTRAETSISAYIAAANAGLAVLDAQGFCHVRVAESGTVTITNSGINNWDQASGAGVFSPHIIDGFTLGDVTNTVPYSGLYIVVFTITTGISAATLQIIQLGIGVNGAEPIEPLATSRPFSVTIPDSGAGASIQELAAGDVLRLYDRNLEAGVGNDILLIPQGQVMIKYIGLTPRGTVVV